MRVIPSPNHGERRENAVPDMVVIHYTAMASADLSCARLCDPEAEVSAHYLIDLDGMVTQLVPEDRRAWHAGRGRWGDVTDVNSRSIGIELQNTSLHPFPAPQMAALEDLLRGILIRHAIPPARVIGHSDMAPDRKSDPGPRFDWARLVAAGLAVAPARVEPPPTDDMGFLRDAVAFGYDPDLSLDLVLRGFRLRFRPWARGPFDGHDAAMMRDLAARYPVDRGQGAG